MISSNLKTYLLAKLTEDLGYLEGFIAVGNEKQRAISLQNLLNEVKALPTNKSAPARNEH